jgi:phage terminase large subunit GpA
MEEHYEVLPPAAITGPFRVHRSPWLGEIMYALCDPLIREVTSMLGAQGAKNLTAEGWISYLVLHNPGNILFYGQTDITAETFATSRALKRARNLDILKHVWPDTKGAKKNNQVHLAHMMLEFLGVGKSNVEGKSAPNVICDEKHLSQWAGMGKIVKQRASAFWDHKILNISTAGDEGSEIDLDYNRGSMEDWHLGCPECKRLCKLVWSDETKLIQWQAPLKGEKPNIRELRKSVRFVCPHEGCGCEERQTTPLMMEMNALGGYVVGNPDAAQDHRSFHVSQIAYPWCNWEEKVEEWLGAVEQMRRGDVSGLRNFIIRVMGNTWENRHSNSNLAHATSDYEITDRDTSPGVFWDQERERFATVDVQMRGGRHYWVCVRAWGAGGVSRLIMAYRCETWDEVEKRIEQHQIKPNRVGVDSRHETEEVKEQCAKMGWYFMIADMTRDEFIWKRPGQATVVRPFQKRSWRDSRVNVPGQRQYAEGVIFSKTWVRNVLSNLIGGQGAYWGLPSDVGNLVFRGTAKIESSYLGQLTSWTLKEVEVKSSGEKKMQWTQINTDDHLRACEEMQLVLAAVWNLFPSVLPKKIDN